MSAVRIAGPASHLTPGWAAQISAYALRVGPGLRALRRAPVTQFSRFIQPDSSFDPETIALLGSVYDEAIAELQDRAALEIVREVIAKRIIGLAAKGERDPVAASGPSRIAPLALLILQRLRFDFRKLFSSGRRILFQVRRQRRWRYVSGNRQNRGGAFERSWATGIDQAR